MNYGQIIRDAWATTWHHRFLWVLGLFTGTAVSTCSGVGNQFPSQMRSGQPGAGSIGAVPAEVERLVVSMGEWIVANLGTIIVAGILLSLLLLVVSIIARAGMTEATVDLARQRPTSLGQAWNAGRHLFWRFLGLALVPIALAIGVGFVSAVGAGLAIVTSALVAEGARGPIIGFWILLAVLAILALAVFAIGLSIVLAYAQRIVVVENAGFLTALGEGWQVMRTHLGSSLLTWLINIALAIGAEIAVGLVMFVVAALLVAVGFVIWTLTGFSVVTGVYVAIGMALAISLLWVMEAIVNTFFWSYWTFAYLRLTGSPAPAAG